MSPALSWTPPPSRLTVSQTTILRALPGLPAAFIPRVHPVSSDKFQSCLCEVTRNCTPPHLKASAITSTSAACSTQPREVTSVKWINNPGSGGRCQLHLSDGETPSAICPWQCSKEGWAGSSLTPELVSASPLSLSTRTTQLGSVAHTCNPSTQTEPRVFTGLQPSSCFSLPQGLQVARSALSSLRQGLTIQSRLALN